MTIIILPLYDCVILIIILNCFNHILCNYYIGNLLDNKIKKHI